MKIDDLVIKVDTSELEELVERVELACKKTIVISRYETVGSVSLNTTVSFDRTSDEEDSKLINSILSKLSEGVK